MNRKQKTLGLQSNQKTILIVDDHPIVRQGLSEIINHENDLEVTGTAEDVRQAMQAIASLDPDLVLVDISLKDASGLELIKDIKVNYPDLPVLTLSMHDETLYAERALRAGAKGYIMKHQATENIINAIRKVLSGQIYVSAKMTEKMMSKLISTGNEPQQSPLDLLSDRELEVFLLIGQGFSTRQISEQLYLSVKTIETYRSHIKEKLGFGDTSEMLQYAISWVNT